MDYHLRANTEQELWAALESNGAAHKIEVRSEGGQVLESRYVINTGYDLDIIGFIFCCIFIINV